MGLFSRSSKSDNPPVVDEPTDSSSGDDDTELVIPKFKNLSYEASVQLRGLVDEVGARGVDIDDLDSIGAAYDSWFAEWDDTSARKREDHSVIIDLLAAAIGEHLSRTTDLEWGMVSDAFGTDVGLGAADDDFMIVPSNLVAVRWLNGETGWVPGAVTHLKRVREAR